MPPTIEDIDPEEPRAPRGRPPNSLYVEMGVISNKLTWVATTVESIGRDLNVSTKKVDDQEGRIRSIELKHERLEAALASKSDAGKYIVGLLSGLPGFILALINIYLLTKGH